MKPKDDDYQRMKEEVLNDSFFRKWIHGVGEGTAKQYMYSLTEFCLATSKTPSELLEICKSDYNKPPWEREIYQWFIDHADYCAKTGVSKDTYRKRTTNVKGFFNFNQVETPKDRRGNNTNFPRANDRQLPKKDEIALLLDSCNTIKQRAIILTQFSSGLSNSDVVRLTVGQFRNGTDENNICTIKMRRKKNEKQFYTFLSPEAVKTVKAYLRVERENLEDSQPLFTKFKSGDQPLKPRTINFIYSRNCDALGWSKDGNAFRKITGHMGRKWLKTNFTNAGMNREPLETILGHKLSQGTDENYYMQNPEALKAIYLKYLNAITIDPTETLIIEGDEFKSLKEENQSLKEEMAQQNEQHQKEIADLKARLTGVESDTKKLSGMSQFLEIFPMGTDMSQIDPEKFIPPEIMDEVLKEVVKRYKIRENKND